MSELNVPKGWALMPMEATPEMEQAAEKYWNERRFKSFSADPRTWQGVYAAMRAAATGNLREDAADQDRDRDRREEVAAALGLMKNGDFSWAFLLQKIREYTKASGREYALPFRLQR